MIVVDSSALVAIFKEEADAEIYAAVIRQADRTLISVVNAYEAAMVMQAQNGAAGAVRVWRFLKVDNDFEIITFDEAQAHQALFAFGRYGRGQGTKARLNFADCVAYALANSMNAPLLFKGNDFAATDVKSALS